MLSLVFLIHIASLMPLVLIDWEGAKFVDRELDWRTSAQNDTVLPSGGSHLEKIADRSQKSQEEKDKLTVK